MLLTVTEIKKQNQDWLVSGNTGTGQIKGIWKADSLSPVIGEAYQIELDFSITERNAVTVRKAPAKAAMKIKENQVIFTALCESIQDIYFLRFSFDGLEMLEIQHDDFTIQEGDFLTFAKYFTEIGIYPY